MKNHIEVVVVVDAVTRKATAEIQVNGLPASKYPVREIKVDGTFYLMRKKGQRPGTKRKKKRAYNRKLRLVKVA